MRVLVIAAHPDDEILGCGGTMNRHINKGDEVEVLIVAEGVTSRENARDTKAVSQELEDLKNISIKANRVLGVSKVSFLGLADNRLDSYDLLDVIKPISEVIEKSNPDIIYTHFDNDLNIDHRIVSQAVITYCRPQKGLNVKEVNFFEVPSSTEWQTGTFGPGFSPNLFVDISDELDNKLKALEVYKSEMREWPHSRSIKGVEHLSRWRGAMTGLEAAEAFVTARRIER
jgi:LmbE family N-acetylglucosaminyl deacetylase